MVVQGHWGGSPEEREQYWSARWTLPEVDCQLTIQEDDTRYCIEIVNYETGMVLAHVDLVKDDKGN
jgi:hypothetical protein